MLKGFKEFLLRGNIIDLAIAVVIGTAFAALVTAFTTAFINPLLGVALGGGVEGGTVGLDKENRLDFGLFINAVITFVITAAVVYFILVVPMKKIMERRAKDLPEPEAKAVAEDIALLTEIRDLLAAQQGSGKAL